MLVEKYASLSELDATNRGTGALASKTIYVSPYVLHLNIIPERALQFPLCLAYHTRLEACSNILSSGGGAYDIHLPEF